MPFTTAKLTKSQLLTKTPTFQSLKKPFTISTSFKHITNRIPKIQKKKNPNWIFKWDSFVRILACKSDKTKDKGHDKMRNETHKNLHSSPKFGYIHGQV
jgi:hypothetical protein